MADSCKPSTLSHCIFGRDWTLIQLLDSLDHAFSLWDSALHFVRFLETNPKDLHKLRGKRVLEVGVGTGLVSMILADVAGCQVIATDLPHVMPNLRACLKANGFSPQAESGRLGYSRVGGEGGSVTPEGYGWGDDISGLLKQYGPFDVIIGTDVVYSEYLVPALLRSVATAALASEGRLRALIPTWHAAVKQCIVFFANEIRCTQTHELFCSTSERYFRVKQLKKSRYHADSRDTSLHIFELRARTDGEVVSGADCPAPMMEFSDKVTFQLCLPLPSLGDVHESDKLAAVIASSEDASVIVSTAVDSDSITGHMLDCGDSLPRSAPTVDLSHRRSLVPVPLDRGSGSVHGAIHDCHVYSSARNTLILRASGLDRTLLPSPSHC